MFGFDRNIISFCSKKGLLLRMSCDRGKIVNLVFHSRHCLEADNDEGWSRQTPCLYAFFVQTEYSGYRRGRRVHWHFFILQGIQQI